jgi:uncharacterized protein YqgQ
MVTVTKDAMLAFSSMIQDQNGANTYSNDKALYGYISADKFMCVTDKYLTAMAARWASNKVPNMDTEILGQTMAFSDLKRSHMSTEDYIKEYGYVVYGEGEGEALDLFRMEMANYYTLRVAGLLDRDAYLAAALRTRWMALGCLYTESGTKWSGNHSPFTELVYLDQLTIRGTGEDVDAFTEALVRISKGDSMTAIASALPEESIANDYLLHFSDTELGPSWIVESAEAIWAIVEYFFRTRGHHWKGEYAPLAKKIFHSAFEGARELPGNVDFSAIFHTAIHPFGVMMLPVQAFHFALCAKIGNAILLRFDAAPNGLAVITTTAAGLTALKTEAWYSAFEKAMREDIEVVKTLAKAILEDKYAYHMSASLYGTPRSREIDFKGKRITIEEARSLASPVATVVSGFISYLDGEVQAGVIKGFALSNAKSIDKPAMDNPSLAIRVLYLCNIVRDAITDLKDATQATSVVFPAIAEMEIQEEAIVKK